MVSLLGEGGANAVFRCGRRVWRLQKRAFSGLCQDFTDRKKQTLVLRVALEAEADFEQCVGRVSRLRQFTPVSFTHCRSG